MTRVGIIADSHGRATTTGDAVRALRDAGAERLIHLGDLETTAVIDELVGQQPAHLVFGNCDLHTDEMTRDAQCVDVCVDHPAGRLIIDGKRIAFTHGHIDSAVDEALRDGVDYLLVGHSHVLRDERIGTTRVINPGALFRASRYTVAVLDPGADRLEIVEIERRRP